MRRTRSKLLACSLVVGLAGCGGGGDDDNGAAVPTTTIATSTTGPASTAVATTTPPTEPPTTADTSTTTATSGSTVAPSSEASPTVASIVAITDPPATLAPAAEDDAFCRDYGALVVSTYLVGLVEAFSADPDSPRRLELIAAPAIDAALSAATAALPPAAAGEAAAFAGRWDGFAQRNAAALAALPPGIDTSELLGAWAQLIATHDVNDPNVTVALSAPTSAAIDGVLAAYAAAAGPVAGDQRVLGSATIATPAVDDHVVERCPQIAALTLGDAI